MCEQCGEAIEVGSGLSRGRFCNAVCYSRNYRVTVLGMQPRSSDTTRACSVCGKHFDVGPREGRRKLVCSQACQAKKYRQNNPGYVAKNNTLGRIRSAERYTPTSYTITCGHCSEDFQARHSTRKYCSPPCSRRAYSQRRQADGRTADQRAVRRALEAGAKITPGRRAEVHAASGHVCQLCLLPTLSELRYPEPLAAVVDHRVAIARGGDHGPSNWQTAHSFCNSKKRELSMDEFHAAFPNITEQVRTLLTTFQAA